MRRRVALRSEPSRRSNCRRVWARVRAPSGMRKWMAEPARVRTKKTASPPGWDGSHCRSRVASPCALSAALTASRKNWWARRVSDTR
eukprot:1869724-Pleurochrysis_carterae.AAC.1